MNFKTIKTWKKTKRTMLCTHVFLSRFIRNDSKQFDTLGWNTKERGSFNWVTWDKILLPINHSRRNLRMMCKKLNVAKGHIGHGAWRFIISWCYSTFRVYLIYGSSYEVECKHTCLLPLITTPLQADFHSFFGLFFPFLFITDELQ